MLDIKVQALFYKLLILENPKICIHRFMLSWPRRPNPEDQIDRKQDDQKKLPNDQKYIKP